MLLAHDYSAQRNRYSHEQVDAPLRMYHQALKAEGIDLNRAAEDFFEKAKRFKYGFPKIR